MHSILKGMLIAEEKKHRKEVQKRIGMINL